MNITADILVIGTGCTNMAATVWRDSINEAMAKFEINTPNRIAAFLANIGVESGGFKELVEDCNYSAQGMANVWPHRYAIDSAADPKVPNDLAERLAHMPEAIANSCYANRMGNGDEASGDGWKFRGQGPIQITGRTNIAACAQAIGIDLISNPALLQHPPEGALSAAWFFASNGCNAKADENDIAGIVKIINGQPPCSANDGFVRISRYSAVIAAISAP
jgi:putative chitinase